MKKGVTRIVFLCKNLVIKIPNYQYSMTNFLKGCNANWSERIYYKTFKNAVFKDNMVDFVSPSYFCAWFGLFQIQKRCEPMWRDLTDKEKAFFEPLCGTDNKKENFGILNGKIVCIDYE